MNLSINGGICLLCACRVFRRPHAWHPPPCHTPGHSRRQTAGPSWWRADRSGSHPLPASHSAAHGSLCTKNIYICTWISLYKNINTCTWISLYKNIYTCTWISLYKNIYTFTCTSQVQNHQCFVSVVQDNLSITKAFWLLSDTTWICMFQDC